MMKEQEIRHTQALRHVDEHKHKQFTEKCAAAITGDSANTFDGMKFEFRISHLKTIGILNVILTDVWYQQLPTRVNVAE